MSIKNEKSCSRDTFLDFVNNNYFDIATFIEAISSENDYPFVFDMKSGKTYITDDLKNMAGFKENIHEDFLNKWAGVIIYDDERKVYYENFENLLAKKVPKHDLKYRIRDAKGVEHWIHCQGILKWSDDGKSPLLFAGKVSKLDKNFNLDSLTRFLRAEEAQINILKLYDKGARFPVIGFALNRFDEINASQGRTIADGCVREISERLRDIFCGDIEFYRLDGLKFMGIIYKKDPDLIQIIDAIKSTVLKVYSMYEFGTKNICSVGIITVEGQTMPPEELVGDLVNLIRSAKRQKNKEYLIYSTDFAEELRAAADMQIALLSDLENHMKNFRVVMQPVIDAKTGKLASAEMLLRWKYHGKEQSPERFVALLEEGNLIQQVGKWVFEIGVRQSKVLREKIKGFKVAINVSYLQILDDTFLPFVKNVLEKYGVDGSCVTIEITEKHYDTSPKLALNFINTCAEMGIKVAIDDFGKGYSSVDFLMKYNTGIVKLDRSLVSKLTLSNDNKNFLAAIVMACHAIRKKVCAEGVETVEEASIVKKLDCDSIQGYYYYKPLELKDFAIEVCKLEKTGFVPSRK